MVIGICGLIGKRAIRHVEEGPRFELESVQNHYGEASHVMDYMMIGEIATPTTVQVNIYFLVQFIGTVWQTTAGLTIEMHH